MKNNEGLSIIIVALILIIITVIVGTVIFSFASTSSTTHTFDGEYPGVEIYVIANVNTTVNGAPAAFNNPVIPKGFKAVQDGSEWPIDWSHGLVIEDNDGNQFVWVPVDGKNVKYLKVQDDVVNQLKEDKLPEGVNSEMDQITKYGGFYISRFEAGKEGDSTLATKQLLPVWTNITYNEAKIKAESMYNTNGLKSGLVTGTQWDTLMKRIEVSGKNVFTESTSWGNYPNSVEPANEIGYGVKQAIGYSENWKGHNIYDLAGNVAEWSTEIYNNSHVIRGGSYIRSAPAMDREIVNNNNELENIGFRVVLYIQ